ncbi:MAG: hypothetical protein ACPIOQ_83395, partial [Promethearchaeia archaeon]
MHAAQQRESSKEQTCLDSLGGAARAVCTVQTVTERVRGEKHREAEEQEGNSCPEPAAWLLPGPACSPGLLRLARAMGDTRRSH